MMQAVKWIISAESCVWSG